MLSLRRILPAVTIGLTACCTVANAKPPAGKSGGFNGLTFDDTKGAEKSARNSRPITIQGNQTESVNRKGGGNDVAMESIKLANEGIDASKLKLLTSKSAEHREGTDQKRMYFNPKEITVDKFVPWQKKSASLSMAEILVRRQPPQSAPLAPPPKSLSKLKVPKGETIYVSTAGGGAWKTTDGGDTWLVAQQPDASHAPSIDVETQKLDRMIPRRKTSSTSKPTEKAASGSVMIPRITWETLFAPISPPPSQTMVPTPNPNVTQAATGSGSAEQAVAGLVEGAGVPEGRERKPAE